MISLKEQESLFIEISKKIKRKIEIYVVGGTAMMLHGLKETTLDIDLVFLSQKDKDLFKEAALSLGYKELDSKVIYGKKENSPEMINLGDSRLDLFLISVIDFVFSENMQKRALTIHEFGNNLIIKVADIHDIIVMKCATRRLKDEDDIINLIKNNKINWDIIINEAKTQVLLGKETAFLDLGSLLERLKFNYKLDISQKMIDELWTLLRKQINKK
jgi:hypothetical protein